MNLYVLHGEYTLLLALVTSLDFGYNTPASRILYLRGFLFLPFKQAAVWSVIPGANGCLDHFSVDNSKGKLTQLCKGVFCAEAGTLLTYVLCPGKQWLPALRLFFLGLLVFLMPPVVTSGQPAKHGGRAGVTLAFRCISKWLSERSLWPQSIIYVEHK